MTIPTKEAMEELTLMLMYLSRFIEKDKFLKEEYNYAWKGYDFDIINKLDDEDYIRQGKYPSRSKSVYITEEGLKKAKELLLKYGIEDFK